MNEKNIQKAVSYIQQKNQSKPKIGLILGSGLGDLGNEIENPVKISYADIPHFPVSTVSGHEGQLVLGTLKGKDVVAMQGRFHYYEGYSMKQVAFPIYVMKQLGVESLIVTNAAGGINESFSPGDLMIITDHINQMGTNPLIGSNDERLGVRFPDMTKAYDTEYIVHTIKCAKKLHLNIREGIYVGNTGPTYETPAEIRMIRTFGADAVGMSTVPEVIAARHVDIRVLGISCISNMAAGVLDQPLSHEEVINTTQMVKEDFLKLVKEVIYSLPESI